MPTVFPPPPASQPDVQPDTRRLSIGSRLARAPKTPRHVIVFGIVNTTKDLLMMIQNYVGTTGVFVHVFGLRVHFNAMRRFGLCSLGSITVYRLSAWPSRTP